MSQDKRHPKSVYDAQYPYNRVIVEESGHETHYDNTPGKERLRRSHKSGSYEEISYDGKWVRMAVGNLVEYIKQGLTRTIDKNSDIKVGGSSRTSIQGGSHTEVKGNHTLAVDGDHKTMIGGDHVTAVKGDHVTGVVGQVKLRLGSGIEVKGDQPVTTKIDGAANLQFGSTLNVYSVSSMSLVCGADITISANTSITLQVGSSHIIIAPSYIYIKSDDVRIGGGSKVEVVSGENLVNPPWETGGSPPQ